MEVKFKKLNSNAIPFSYSRDKDSCLDMFTLEADIIPACSVKPINTGIAIEIPDGYEGIVRGRSGYTRDGYLVQIGTIESTYRGEVKIMVYNPFNYTLIIPEHSKLAQLAIRKSEHIEMIEVESLSKTERGSNGFGSSGK